MVEALVFNVEQKQCDSSSQAWSSRLSVAVKTSNDSHNDSEISCHATTSLFANEVIGYYDITLPSDIEFQLQETSTYRDGLKSLSNHDVAIYAILLKIVVKKNIENVKHVWIHLLCLTWCVSARALEMFVENVLKVNGFRKAQLLLQFEIWSLLPRSEYTGYTGLSVKTMWYIVSAENFFIHPGAALALNKSRCVKNTWLYFAFALIFLIVCKHSNHCC